MPTRFRPWARIAALACGVLVFGCAEEREAINRVQPNAYEKSFFVGAKLSDASDNPEFYYRPTVVDVDYGAKQDGLFTASYAQTLARVGWEITEDLLIARLTYERVEDSSGHGAPDDDSGQIVAAFKIESHFDPRYAYNPSTGEELNIVEENTTDRPWYEREYFHVDFSQNLVTSAYELDTLAALRAYSENSVEYEPATYSADQNDPEDKPAFDKENGYLDVTNRVFAKPQIIETPWGAYPACFLTPDLFGGSGPDGNCNPVELKIRLAFKKITDTDYEPVEWDGQRQQMFGAFTTGLMGQTRLGYDRNYGVVDAKWHRFANRHNIWKASHVREADGTLKACSEVADTCSATPGSHCDVHVGACTIPLRERTTKPVVYYYGPGSDPSLFETAKLVADDWDSALRHAVQTGRYAECVRERGGVTNDDAIGSCREEYPPSLEGALEKVPRILFFCHNPVTEEDPAECGDRNTLIRVGDLRYHMANIIESPQTPSPWGIMSDATDPISGEVVAASVNVWNAVTDLQTQRLIDLSRWYLGELSTEDVETGNYVKAGTNIGPAPGTQTVYRGPSLLSKSEVDQRIGAIDQRAPVSGLPVEVPPVSARNVVDWASELTRQTFGAEALGRGNTEIQSRFLTIQSSSVEAELTTQPFLTLVGLNRTTQLDNSTLALASPLRATFWQNRGALERERQLQLAASGRCMLEAAEPSNAAELGAALLKKFPAGTAIPGRDAVSMTPEELRARNQRFADYLRKRITRSVLAHEMGHSMGLRHVFTSNVDAINFRPQYWQLRTRDKRETTYCTEPTEDGASCIGPRWLDPVTSEEREGFLTMWQQTTVMDYPGDLSQELLDIGPYDRAAIRFIYADVSDIWADPADTCSRGIGGAITCPPRSDLLADRLDNFGGLLGPIYGWTERRTLEGARHYSRLDQELDLIRDCESASTDPPEDWDEAENGVYDPVIDGFVVNGTRCSTPPTDYVAYGDLEGVTENGETIRKFDARLRVRRPYLFASDEYADIGNVAVYRQDSGADPYEIASFFIHEYEDLHVFDNHRRGRTTFSLSNAFMRSYSRYNSKLREMSKAFAYLNEIFSGTIGMDVYANGEFSDGIARPLALASSLVFDHFTRMLTRPASGPHFLPGKGDAAGNFILRSKDQNYVANAATGREVEVEIPEGTDNPGFSPSLGGRPLHNALDQSKGYYATDYDLWVGSYYDKVLALDLLQDSTDRFISQSRDDFQDGRYRNVSFATLYPEAMRRLVANTLTDDSDLIGWRVPTRANGAPTAGKPRQPMGFPLWWPADGPTTCWPAQGSLGCSEPEAGLAPATSVAIDPEVGFEVQKFIALFSLIYLPESWKRDWVDLMRVYRIGADPTPGFPEEESIVYRDPLSGEKYVAHSLGKENILGRDVEQAIGARMLEWANTLASKAYQVESVDPVTGELTYARHADASNCPTSQDCTGDVIPAEDSALYVTRLKGYQSLIDFVRRITANLGFYGPNFRGVF